MRRCLVPDHALIFLHFISMVSFIGLSGLLRRFPFQELRQTGNLSISEMVVVSNVDGRVACSL